MRGKMAFPAETAHAFWGWGRPSKASGGHFWERACVKAVQLNVATQVSEDRALCQGRSGCSSIPLPTGTFP